MDLKGKGYIITESASNNITPSMIVEKPNSVKFVAEIQEAEAPNRNKRIYSKLAIDEAIKHYTIQEKLKNKALYGEAAHPLTDDPRRQMYIDQGNISHIVTKVWWDGNRLMANIETANTRVGKDMRGLILQGSRVAFSMRGMSDNIRQDGAYQRVGSPLMITTWDWVVVPSHPNSYMQSSESSIPVRESIEAKYADKQAVLTEGILTPYNTKELLDYVTNKSSNVHELVESLGFEMTNENTSIGKDQMLSIKNDNETLKIFLEETLKRDLTDFYSSFA